MAISPPPSNQNSNLDFISQINTSSNGEKKNPFADKVALPAQGFVTGIVQVKLGVLHVY